MKKFLLLLTVMVSITSASIGQSSSFMENPPPPVFVETQINTNHAPGECNFLVFMDNLPWGSTSIQDILTTNGETFSVANSSFMASIDFSLYDVIIIASDQVPGFYVNFAASFPEFVDFVTNGGSLQVHSATCGWNSPCGYSVVLPGGVFTTENYEFNNAVVAAAHPIVAGVTSPFAGNYASHGYFSNLQPGTEIITEEAIAGRPTTIQYQYGSGIVTATTVTYEHGYDNGYQAGIMLVNNLNYGCDHAIAADVPVSDWAIGIGIFLILAAAFVRYKRIF